MASLPCCKTWRDHMARRERSEWTANRHLAIGARQPTRPRPVQARRRITVGEVVRRYGPALLAFLVILEVTARLAF